MIMCDYHRCHRFGILPESNPIQICLKTESVFKEICFLFLKYLLDFILIFLFKYNFRLETCLK